MLKSTLLLSIFFTQAAMALPNQKGGEPSQVPRQAGGYEAKDFSHLIGMKGFSKQLLTDHFTLYRGYVKNTNLLVELLGAYLKGKPLDYQYQALKRRFGWEFDGMRLHEYYFGNLGKEATSLSHSSTLYQQIERDFGSFDSWKKDFIATGMMRGIGWSVLYFDPQARRLFNTWINEHDLGHLAGGNLILVMDVWEHAYMPEYGLNRREYIHAFFQNIKWETVQSRMERALMKK